MLWWNVFLIKIEIYVSWEIKLGGVLYDLFDIYLYVGINIGLKCLVKYLFDECFKFF